MIDQLISSTFKNGFTYQQIADMEVFCMRPSTNSSNMIDCQHRSAAKKWTVYRIIRTAGLILTVGGMS